MDLEKAFDRMPNEVVWWALMKPKIDEWLVKWVMAIYDKNVRAVENSEEFRVKVGYIKNWF